MQFFDAAQRECEIFMKNLGKDEPTKFNFQRIIKKI